MRIAEKIFAGLMLALCLLLLVRMTIGPQRRQRLDAALRRWRAPWRRRLQQARRSSAESRAERTAQDAIARARRTAAEGEWDGNVYRPKSFKRKKRDLH